MPAVHLYGSLLLCTFLVPRMVVGATVRVKTCPLAAHCPNVDAGAASLLEVSSKSSALAAAKSHSTAGGYANTFLPAHFTCSSCDQAACKGCNHIVCDVSKCTGKFYTQECWCTKPLSPDVEKFFCDSDCTGGVCNTNGLTCKTRETACKPWWWCKLPPPKESKSFMQTITSRHGTAKKKDSSNELNHRLAHTKAQLAAMAALKERSASPKRQIDDFDFQPGAWSCESALLPSPDEDPVSLAQTPAGFIVMDGSTCSGGFFKSKCFCWDKFLYLRGEDAKVNELDCDDGCGQGPCGGKTCAKKPPPPLPAPTPAPPLDPLLQELANEGMLRNYGTQMSPVQ